MANRSWPNDGEVRCNYTGRITSPAERRQQGYLDAKYKGIQMSWDEEYLVGYRQFETDVANGLDPTTQLD